MTDDERQLKADTATATYEYWKNKVQLSRRIMGYAIADYEEASNRLQDAEEECRKLLNV